MTLARQRLRGMAIGFVSGAIGSFATWFAFLLHDVTLPYFEALYETRRPYGLRAMLRLQRGDEILYLLVGMIGAVIGLATSGRPLVGRILAIPGLALVGTVLITSAYVNIHNLGEQPYWLLVAIALAGVMCLVSAAWIGFHVRPSRIPPLAPRRWEMQ